MAAPSQVQPKAVLSIERYYTPEEVAGLVHFDTSTIRRAFRDVPGVLKYGDKRRGTRDYCTLRIPESVLRRWLEERSR